jgi:hypothetical protein
MEELRDTLYPAITEKLVPWPHCQFIFINKESRLLRKKK